MTFWFMKMKQGAKGEDFAKELWQQGLVGVMFGTWRIEHVLDDEGKPDKRKLTAEAIQTKCPQPEGIDFNDTFLWAPKVFLLKVAVGDRVVVAFDKAIHIGTVGTGYRDDPDGPRGPYEEYFKCRPVYDRKPFPLTDLPASYRLVSSMGRRAIQGIDVYEKLIRLLDEHRNAQEVRDALGDMPTQEFLDTLSDKQWEVLCDQSLRDMVGLRSLVLGVGGTLKDVDIYGVDRDGTRVLAQCKNDTNAWKRKRLKRLIAEIPSRPEDSLYFLCRGGVEDGDDDLGCQVVDGEEISRWLEADPVYLQRLKTM